MRYQCNGNTDLTDLFGREENTVDGIRFRYGPIPQAMRNNEEIVLENSAALSKLLLAKIGVLSHDFFVVETEEQIHPGKDFHLILA